MKKIIFLSAALGFAMATAAQAQDTTLRFGDGGRFRIVQFTDLHYLSDSPESAGSLAMMERILDAEKPDMVAFTGDVAGSDPVRRGWDEVLKAVIDRAIPYAVALGNHDDEKDWNRRQIMDYVALQPYCLATGERDYALEIMDGYGAGAVLWFMDSGAYGRVGEEEGYGWPGFDQVEWYRRKSASFTQANGGEPLPALAFFHIPLREYMQLTGVVGTREEKECAGLLNTGMFAAMVEAGDVMGTFTGHDHNNDYIGCLYGVCLAYGRFSGGRTTYTDIGAGARVIELTAGRRTFDTWIRTDGGEAIHAVKYPDDFRRSPEEVAE